MPAVTEAAPRCAERPHDLDFALLATRAQLAAAFGAVTGLHRSWFSNLADTPVLQRARKWVEYWPTRGVKEFWFCPLEVMQWLVHSKRKRGRPLEEEQGWALLKQHFPLVYRRQVRRPGVLKQNPAFILPARAANDPQGHPHVFQHPLRRRPAAARPAQGRGAPASGRLL